jgi:glycosyltransferase involved in cell wall biosynthesis
MILLTIIIPYYNSVRTLERLLISIGNDQRIQVIIIDDNSDINLDSYNTLRLKYPNFLWLINKSSNKGAGACRNIGIMHAVGKCVLFADSDDFFTPNYFFKLENLLIQHFDIVFFPPISINEGNFNKSKRHIPYKNLIY